MPPRPSTLFYGYFALLLFLISSQVNEIDSMVTVTKCSSLSSSETHLKIPESLQAPFPQQQNSDVYNFTLKSRDHTNDADEGHKSDDQTLWRPGEVPCALKMKPTVYLPLNKTYALDPSEDDPVNILLLTQYYFAPSGYFYDGSTNILHHPDNYCISRMTSAEIEVQFCLPVVNGTGRIESVDQTALKKEAVVPKPIKKCCPVGMLIKLPLDAKSFNDVEFSCDFPQNQTSAIQFTPLIKDLEVTATEPVSAAVKQKRHFNFLFEDHFSQCNGSIGLQLGYEPEQNVMTDLRFHQIKTLETGEVVSRESGNHRWVKHEIYCQDLYSGYGSPVTGETGPFGPLKAYCDESSQEVVVDEWFYFASHLLCTAFLLATVIVYGLIWPKENVHGWTVACLAVSLLMSNVCDLTSWCFSIWTTAAYEVLNSTGCVAVAVLAHFFSIAMFTWMTLVNFDLWLAIGSMTAIAERSKGMIRFKIYCCVGFGLPTTVVTISLLLENLFGFFDDRVIRPQYGQKRCYLDQSAEFYHLMLVTTALFTINIICGVLTLRTLWNFKKGTKMVEKSNSQSSRSSAVLFGKLFVIMGFTWVFSIGSYLAVGSEIKWFKTVADVYNILQGSGIFWIFVCKRDVRDKLAGSYALFNDFFHWWDERIGSKFGGQSKSAPSSSSAPSTKSSADA